MFVTVPYLICLDLWPEVCRAPLTPMLVCCDTAVPEALNRGPLATLDPVGHAAHTCHYGIWLLQVNGVACVTADMTRWGLEEQKQWSYVGWGGALHVEEAICWPWCVAVSAMASGCCMWMVLPAGVGTRDKCWVVCKAVETQYCRCTACSGS